MAVFALIESPERNDEHELNLRVLRFRAEASREEPTLLAQQLMDTGRYGEAAELTARALLEDATDVDALMLHGRALLRSGDPRSAQQALMRAASAAPDWSETWIELAEVLLARRKPHSAARVAAVALDLEPDSDRARRLRDAARLRVRAEHYVRNPGPREDPAMLAQALLANDDPQSAFEVTRTALLEDLDDPDLLVAHARAAKATGDLQEAASVLSTALVSAGDWAEVHRLLAEIYEEMGEVDRARDAAGRAMAINPADSKVRQVFVRVRRRRKSA